MRGPDKQVPITVTLAGRAVQGFAIIDPDGVQTGMVFKRLMSIDEMADLSSVAAETCHPSRTPYPPLSPEHSARIKADVAAFRASRRA